MMDQINAIMEIVATGFILPSIYVAITGRLVRGVHWITPAFFTAYGLWNLGFYAFLMQWWSFGAGLILMSVDAIWLYCVLKFGEKQWTRT